MCGIVGIIKEDTDRAIEMFIQWRRKGSDGVGIMALKDKAIIKKFPLDPVNMILNYGKEIKKLNEDSNILIYHTRKATIGDINTNGIHPFVGERYIVFHNGTVHRHSLIPKNKKWKYKAGSDTEKIAAFLNDKKNRNDLIGSLQELVNLVYTIGVLIIYDRKENLFYLYRDDSRELVLVSKENDNYSRIEDIENIVGFNNSLELARRFYSRERLFMAQPYSVIEIDSTGFIYDIYDLKAPEIIDENLQNIHKPFDYYL